MSYKQLIDNIKPFQYSEYSSITSNEKLMLYAALVLEKMNIPLTFNYLCVATFKIFPEKFCLDEEFKEFPSVDRLNRTVMHLKYVKNSPPYIAGSVKDGYDLTKLGRTYALEVEAIIYNTEVDKTIKAPPVDRHKKGFSKDYLLFKEGSGYKKYLDTGIVDEMYIWEYYKIIPFTQMKSTKENLGNILNYAKERKDDECATFIETILSKF